MKVGRRLLSVLLSITLIVSAFSFALVPASAYEQADLDTQRRGGVAVYFFKENGAGQTATTTLNSLDPSNMGTSHIRIASHSSHTVHLTEWGEGYEHTTIDKASQNTLEPGNGSYFTVNFKDADQLKQLPHGDVLDFSVKYTMEDVYDENGDLVVFEAPAYLGVWDTSTDVKSSGQMNIYANNGTFGAEINLYCRFDTTAGLFENFQGDASNFYMDYYLDSTGMEKTWQAAEFRLFAHNNSNTWSHFQSTADQSSCGTITLTGNFPNKSTASFSIGDFVTPWSGPSTYPFLSVTPSTYIAQQNNNFTSKRMWDPINNNNGMSGSNAHYATLKNTSGAEGSLPFGGGLFEGNTDSRSPSDINFVGMRWNAHNGAHTNMNGTIHVYVYDKTNLIAALNSTQSDLALQNFAPISGRYTQEDWTAYVTALRNARNVLADYTTTQYDVNQVTSELIAAVKNLESKDSLGTQVAKVTDSLHDGGDKQTASTDSNRYFLVPLDQQMTVDPLTQSGNVNRHSAALTVGPYTRDNTSINDGGKIDYWYIDESAADSELLDAAQEIINKQASGEYCYTEEYYQAVKDAKTALEELMIDGSAVPETQAEFDEAVETLSNLVSAEALETNHRHSDPDVREEVVTEATCQHGGRKEIRCKYCDTVIEEQEIPTQPHNYEGAEWVIDKEANCSETGSKHQECQYPDCTERNVVEIPVNDSKHGTTHKENGQAYNCLTGSYEGDIYCDLCNRKIGEGERTPGSGAHQWKEDEVKYKDDKAPTCTDGATRIVTCSVCGATEERQVEALGHSYSDTPYKTEQGDCVTPGKQYFRCENGCGEDDIRDTVTDPDNHAGHEYVKEGTHKDATCKEAGYEGDIYCDACNHKVRNGDTLDKLPHSFTNNWIPVQDPGCVTTGLKSLQCDNCDEFDPENTDVTIAATGHNYPDEPYKTEPGDCVTPGKQYFRCENGCGIDDIKNTATDPDKHVGEEYVLEGTSKDAACESEGYEGDIYCNACNQKIRDGKTLDKLGHNFDYQNGKITKKATYEHSGTIEYKCTRCTATEEKEYTIGDHEHEGGKATCVSEAICIICEAPYGGVDPNNHAGPEYAKEGTKQDATCAAEGHEDDIYCTACNQMIRAGAKIDKLPHTFDKWEVTLEAGCETTGKKTLHCSVCNAIDPENTDVTIAATGHNYPEEPDETIEGDCVTEGRKIWYCDNNCGKNKEEKTGMNPENHAGPEYVLKGSGQAATCTADGREDDTYCRACGRMVKEGATIGALGHSPVAIPGKEPTCFEDGQTGGETCSRCGKQITPPTIIPKGTGTHRYGDGVVQVEPTSKREGFIRYTCEICGYTYDEILPALDHDHTGGKATCVKRAVCETCGEPYGEYDNSVHEHIVPMKDVEPTCTEDGHKGGTQCADCGKVIDAPTVLPATGHRDENGDGICDVDGKSIYDTDEPDGGYTWDSFRCKYCFKYASLADQPVVGPFYRFVHFFVHLGQYIAYLFRK